MAQIHSALTLIVGR